MEPEPYQSPNFSHRPPYQQFSPADEKRTPLGGITEHNGENYPEEQYEEDEEYAQESYPVEKHFPNTGQAAYVAIRAPPAGHFTRVRATEDDVGTFNSGSYQISHRDTNTLLQSSWQ
jgi:hypothetical protein